MSPQEFDALFAGLRQLRAAEFAGGAAMATLLRTRGPVFRRAGARMLVFGDGRILRGLSAGCPEADIAERAREVIKSGEARLVRYDREHGYDALLELGCGGEMEILIEPLTRDAALRSIDALAQCLRQRQRGLLLTAFSIDGRCLPQPRRLLWFGQTVCDEFGDARLSETLLAAARPHTGPASVIDVDSHTGTHQLFIERIEPKLRLILIGINSSSIALAKLAGGLGWEVVLVDHRDGTPASEQLPRPLRATPQTLTQQLTFDSRTATVVMTHNIERDLDYLRALRGQPLLYLGALGSRARASRMIKELGEGPVPLHVPAGLDIGSETPEEIALAIAAEIQAVASRHDGGHLNARDGAIH